MINLADDGRFKVVFLETTLPALKVVTVTFLTGFKVRMGALIHSSIAFFVTAFDFTVGYAVEVLRVLVLRGAFGAVAVDLDAVDLRGIGIDSDVYSINIHEKTPLWGFCVPVCQVVYLSLKPPRPRHAVNGRCNCSSF